MSDSLEIDLLSQVLESVHLRSAYFFVWQPRWPYSTGIPNGAKFSHLLPPGNDQVISYHIVVEGPCWGCVTGEPPVLLNSGDILVLPHGDAYAIGNEARPPSPDDEKLAIEFFTLLGKGQIPSVIEDGGPGPTINRIICGFLGCDMRPFNPLLATLPRCLRIPAPQKDDDPLKHLIEFAVHESSQQRQGGRCVLARLSELMFVEVIRRYFQQQDDGAYNWLTGLRDPIVGAALRYLHEQADIAWTIETLAQKIGTSRSSLADRFNQVVGMPPMQYLTHWRMQVAARKLTDGYSKSYAIAKSIGYESEASFSRAFKRVVGMSPARWRERFRS